MIKDLIKLSNRLDQLGLTKEADFIDKTILKLASREYSAEELDREIQAEEQELAKYRESRHVDPQYFYRTLQEKHDSIDWSKRKNPAQVSQEISAAAKSYLKGNDFYTYVGSDSEKEEYKRAIEEAYSGNQEAIDNFRKALSAYSSYRKAPEDKKEEWYKRWRRYATSTGGEMATFLFDPGYRY